MAKMVVSNIASSNTTLQQPTRRVSPVRFAIVVIGDSANEVAIIADFREPFQTMEVLREKIDAIDQIAQYVPPLCQALSRTDRAAHAGAPQSPQGVLSSASPCR